MSTKSYGTLQLITISPQPWFGVRKNVKPQNFPQLCEEGYGKSVPWLQQNTIKFNYDLPSLVYFSHHPEQGTIDAGAGFFIENGPVRAEGFESVLLPGGTAARLLYVGPYEALGEVHAFVHRELGKQGLKKAGMSWDVYLNDPATVPPEQLKTEITYLLSENNS